jgi:hypothetical protein
LVFSFTNDLFAGGTRAFRAEHQPSDVLGTPLSSSSRGFRRSFCSQNKKSLICFRAMFRTTMFSFGNTANRKSNKTMLITYYVPLNGYRSSRTSL